MIQVVRNKGKLVKGTHNVYTRAEADELGLRYVWWRDALAGDWCLSDDGWVMQCLAVKWYYDSRRSKISRFDVYTRWIYFGVGRITGWKKEFWFSLQARGMNAISGKPWQEQFCSSRRGRVWIKMAAVMMIQREVDYMFLGEMLGFDRRFPESVYIMVRRYLRNHLIENAIVFQMSEFLRDNGITFDKVLSDYKDVLGKAIKDGKYGDAIKILEKMERWTGLDRKIAGDTIDHAPGEDLVGARIAELMENSRSAKLLPGGGSGVKVPASVDTQLFDGDGNRLEYIPVESKGDGDTDESML